LWKIGKKYPAYGAVSILKKAKSGIPNKLKAGLNKYIHDVWEMIYNPTTKEVWHMQPMK
jgi:filamentous hemagglutinin